MLNRGVCWAPPRRCGHDARPNGYCGQHQPDNKPVAAVVVHLVASGGIIVKRNVKTVK